MEAQYKNSVLSHHLSQLERGDVLVLEERTTADELQEFWQERHPERKYAVEVKAAADHWIVWAC